MYQVERKDNHIIVRDNNAHTIYRASLDSLIIYREGEEVKIAKTGDLTDTQLLLALVNAVQIKDFGK